MNKRRRNVARMIPKDMGDKLMARINLDCKECPSCGAMTLWTGNNQSAMVRAIVEIDRVRYSVRRTVYQIAHDFKPINPRLCIVSMCQDQRCVNPEHLKTTTKSGVVKHAIARGLLHNVVHHAAIKVARRARGDAKMDLEKAREVRQSNLTPTQLAERFGVSRQAISQILRGKVWVESSNPFAGLGARA